MKIKIGKLFPTPACQSFIPFKLQTLLAMKMLWHTCVMSNSTILQIQRAMSHMAMNGDLSGLDEPFSIERSRY